MQTTTQSTSLTENQSLNNVPTQDDFPSLEDRLPTEVPAQQILEQGRRFWGIWLPAGDEKQETKKEVQGEHA